jgi:hypothetical protein
MRVIPSQFTLVGLLAVSLGTLTAPGCGDGEVGDLEEMAGSGGKGGSGGRAGQGGEAGEGGSGDATGFPVDAVAASIAETITLSQSLADVVDLGGIVVGFHEDTGASILDLSDPQSPEALAPLASTGAVVGAAYDAARHLLYLLSASGDLRAWQVADPTHPVQAAKITLNDTVVTAVARVGERLFALGQAGITPVLMQVTSTGTMSGFKQESPVAVDGVEQFASGGGQLYVAKAGGQIEVFSAPASGSPRPVDSFQLEDDVVGLVARGAEVVAAVRNKGLRVIDFSRQGSPSLAFAVDDVADVVSLRRSGNLMLLGLGRDLALALDVSTLSAPRALVSRSGPLPKWMVASHGNLVLGSGTSLSVLGVPPFVSSSVPAGLRASFPRYGRIPLQLSKPVDPRTVTDRSVKLRCGAETVATSLALSPDNARITLLPQQTLPAGSDCSVDFDGVEDALGLRLSSPGSLGLKTSTVAPGAVENARSSYPHAADGAFSDWKPGQKSTNFEYGDGVPAMGMYSKLYADHDGSRLWLLNDWLYSADAIEPDCYSRFELYTGNGSEAWEIRAYGDQHVEVRKNGQLLAAGDDTVTGGYSHAASPNDSRPHTVYEIAVETTPGAWSVQLSNPGPTFACSELETDPTTFDGASTLERTSLDPTRVPVAPATPELDEGGSGTLASLTPTLSWSSADEAGAFTQFRFELSRGETFGRPIFQQWVYGRSFTLPPGLLMVDTTYTWRVTGYNLAGTEVSEPASFSVPSAVDVVAPVLSDVQPTSVVQGTATTLSISGSGFVEGAQVFLGEFGVATMFESETSLLALLSVEDTAVAGEHNVTVRNSPDDANTASEIIGITITPKQQSSDCAHSECNAGERLAIDCSPCASDVCETQEFAYCCEELWDAACAAHAASFGTCSCDVGTAGQSGTGGLGGSGGGAGLGGSGGIGSGDGGFGGSTAAAGRVGAGGSGGSGGSGGAPACSPNCADPYPLGSGPTICDDASLPLWSALNACACSSFCVEQCPLSCSGMDTASTEPGCYACIYEMCYEEYLACSSDGAAG